MWIILSQLQKILDKDRLKAEHACCFSARALSRYAGLGHVINVQNYCDVVMAVSCEVMYNKYADI